MLAVDIEKMRKLDYRTNEAYKTLRTNIQLSSLTLETLSDGGLVIGFLTLPAGVVWLWMVRPAGAVCPWTVRPAGLMIP